MYVFRQEAAIFSAFTSMCNTHPLEISLPITVRVYQILGYNKGVENHF